MDMDEDGISATQKKWFKEVLAKVGSGEMPAFEDWSSLWVGVVYVCPCFVEGG